MTERTEARQSGFMMEDDEISLFALGSTLIRHRWRIARWMVLGGALAVIPVLFQPLTYTATASFVPAGAPDPSRSGLASLAGQFGLSLGGGGGGQLPEFYADLLRTRVILAPIVMDTFTVAEKGGVRRPFLDLMEIPKDFGKRQLEVGVMTLGTLFQTTIVPKTGVVNVSVTTPWPSVSLALTERLIAGVNAFNLRTRQSQASEERRFTEARLAEARLALRAAEDRLQGFLQGNRQWESSAELRFDHDRLARDLALQQQIVTSLALSYEEVRIREIRDTPVITPIEQPTLPAQPNSRGRTRRGLFGILIGGFLGCLATFVGEIVRRRRAVGDPEAEAFFGMWREMKAGVRRLIFRRRQYQG